MKKHVIIIALMIFSTTAMSQIKYGASFGLNSSRFSNDFETVNGSYFNTKSMGIYLGGYLDYNLNEKISLYPKLLYIQIGDREKDQPTNRLLIDKIDYKLDYISIPLNIKFFNKFYVYLGPQINFLINYEAQEADLGKPEKSLDIGGNLGFGYDFGKFKIESNFYQGFTNVFEIKSGVLSNQDLNVKNLYLNLNISYQIK